MPKTPTLGEIASSGFLKTDLKLFCVTRGESFLKNLNGITIDSKEYRCFPVLKRDGKIHFENKMYEFPTKAARAVRQIVEGRSDSIPEKTGGWLYWHFQGAGGKWIQLDELRVQAKAALLRR